VFGYLLMALYIIACFVLILFVLLQPGKSDAAQVFGGGANSSAFGPRGTQTVMAKITIGAAIAFFLIAFIFAEIPGVSEDKSVGGGIGPASETAPAAPLTTPVAPAPEQTPPAGEAPAVTTPAPPEKKPAAQPAAPAQKKDAAKPAEKKPETKQP
jgi:preprotein translocase subunit SecG